MPDFLEGTFLWDARGYDFAKSPPAEIMSDRSLVSDNPWIRLSAVLLRAKSGNWNPLHILERTIVTTDDPFLTTACAELYGHASPASYIRGFVPELLNRTDELRLAASQIIYCSGLLQSLPWAIDAWRSTAWPDTRYEMSSNLSDLLEPIAGEAFAFESAPDEEAYCQLLSAKVLQLIESLGTDLVAVWKGKAANVVEIARFISKLLNTPGRSSTSLEIELIDYRQRFECATGISCSAFFSHGAVQRLSASSIVEQFLERPDAEKYQPGGRYFFGHLIPD